MKNVRIYDICYSVALIGPPGIYSPSTPIYFKNNKYVENLNIKMIRWSQPFVVPPLGATPTYISLFTINKEAILFNYPLIDLNNYSIQKSRFFDIKNLDLNSSYFIIAGATPKGQFNAGYLNFYS